MQLAFIVGTGRCGSTLLHEIFAKHQHTSFISVIEERHRRLARFYRWANTVYRAEHSALLGRFADEFIPTEGYALIDRSVSPIYSRPYRDLTADDVTPWLEKRFRSFFEQRYEIAGLPMMLHKYTGWSRLGFFARIFPEARFVHVVRDGRAVANSWLQMRWWSGYQGVDKWLWGPLTAEEQALWEAQGQTYPALAGISWRKLMESFQSDEAQALADRVLTIRYEDFLEDAQGHCRKILDFVGLEWSKDFEEQFATFEIRAGRKTAYRADLETAQLMQIEACCADLLEQFGYSG